MAFRQRGALNLTNAQFLIVDAVYDRAFPGINELRAVIDRAYNSSRKLRYLPILHARVMVSVAGADRDPASTTFTLNWLVLTFPLGMPEIVPDCASSLTFAVRGVFGRFSIGFAR